jgi:glucosamine--fructose-6-phosphate aminotransferase (isomerizing)
MSVSAVMRGIHTQEEILSQPRCWEECWRSLEDHDRLGQVARQLGAAPEWLFIGCGSSYYVAQAAAASWTALTGQRGWAAPASELLWYPDLALPGKTTCQPVLISRSGHTSEILQAAEWLELKRNIRTLAVSCATHQPLEGIATATLYLLPADERSMVMTRSFSSMVLALQGLAALVGDRPGLLASLKKLPEQAGPLVAGLPPRIRQFVESHDFANYVVLAQGPFVGVARETALKVQEMSCSSAQWYHTLEFRHGPKATVGPETLVVFVLGEAGCDAEREVLAEVKGLGGTTFVIANHADPAVRRAADFVVELSLDVEEIARLAASIIPGQLLGLYTGLKKGHDPDRPRNLSRAVILEGSG